MRQLALLICLLLFTPVAFSGQGESQNKANPKASRVRRVKPAPTPALTDDFFADIPDAKPTPIPNEPDSFEGLPPATPEWKYIGFPGRGVMLYYNTQRITYPDTNVRRVWNKARPLGQSRDKWTAGLEDSSHSYTLYSYTISQEEFDCVATRARLLRATDYTLSGEVIRSARASGGWYELVPDSLGEVVLKAVCQHKK